jgi:hypothetical protein
LLPSALAGGFFMKNNRITLNNAEKLAKINSTGLYVPDSTWEFPIDLDILESLTTDFSRNSRFAGLLKCEIEGPIGGITTYYFYELGTIQIRKKRGGWSEIFFKRFEGLFWDKDLLIRKKELQDAIFNDYIDRVRLEVEESNKTVPDAPAAEDAEVEKRVTIRSEKTEALNELAAMWVNYNQTRTSKFDDMTAFLTDKTEGVGLTFISVNQFKKYLPKAYKAGIIDKDEKTGRFIPKLAT